MFKIQALMCLLFLCACLLKAEQTYDIESHPLRVELRAQVIAEFKQNGLEAAMGKLPAFKMEMLEIGFKENEVYEHVWKEAQLHLKNLDFRYRLYEWIFLDSTNGDLSGKTPCYSDTILFNTLVSFSRDMGKLAQGEKWAQVGRRMAEYQYGIVYDLERYPDTEEAVHPAFPGLKNKKFPLRSSEQLNAPRLASREYVAYSKLRIHEQLMEQSYYRGDWRSAMLYAEWIKQYSDALAASPHIWHTHNHQELERMNSDAIALQAELMWLMGKREMAEAHLQAVIDERPSYYYGTHYKRGMTAVWWRAALGRKVPEDLEYLESRIEKMAHNRFFNGYVMGHWNTRSRIWWLFNNDRREEAVALMNTYFQEKPAFWRADWEMYLDMIMMEGDRRPESEEVFLKLLESYRKMGQKIYEPFLYEKYARWLSWQGRFEEAIAIQKEAVRLFGAFRMPEMRAQALVSLDQYERGRTEQRKEAAAPPAEAEPEIASAQFPIAYQAKPAGEYRVDVSAAAVDLQPKKMHSVHRENRKVQSHFTLANPGRDPMKGVLEISPAQDLEVERGEAALFLNFRADPGLGDAELPLELEPERLLTLNLESFSNHEDGGNVRLHWKPENTEGIESVWTFVQGDGFGTGDFTNAGAYLNNPFYLVPIYQAMLRDNAEAEGSVDFRIVASEPMRIEVYNLSDDLPVFIDDQGDGELDGVGDVLAQDSNANGLPDLKFEAGRFDSGFVLYFLPRPDREAGPVELSVEILDDGKWVPRTVHTIDFQP